MRPLAALLLASLAAWASPQTPADALRGNSKALVVGDLPEGYRAVSLSASDGGLGGISSVFMMGVGMGMGSQSNEDARSKVLFALMGTSFVDPDEFAALLDGKRPRIRAYTMDLGTMIANSGHGSKVPAPLFTETWIEAGRILQWSPKPALTKAAIIDTFLKADLAEDSPGDKTAGVSNVKQVALGMMMYANDYDDVFPRADSSDVAKHIVMPYVKDEAVWQSPAGGRVLYNTALSGVSSTSLERPAETLLVWEEKPYPDGTRGVGYADGHAVRKGEAEWAQIWAMELRRRQRAKMDGAARAATSAKKVGSVRPSGSGRKGGRAPGALTPPDAPAPRP